MKKNLATFKKALSHRLFPRYSETLDKINKNALYFEHVVNEFENKEVFESRYDLYEWVNDLMKGHFDVPYSEKLYHDAALKGKPGNKHPKDPHSREWVRI